MTLQDFKDKVARELGYDSYQEFMEDAHHMGEWENLNKETDRAADLYGNDQFKEGRKEGWEEGYSCGANNATH
jgi:hypothetical protein